MRGESERKRDIFDIKIEVNTVPKVKWEIIEESECNNVKLEFFSCDSSNILTDEMF